MCRFTMAFFNFIIPAIATVLTGWNVYYQYQAVQIMKASAVSQRQRAAAAPKSWWSSPQIWIVALLAAVTWIPWIYGLINTPSSGAEYGYSSWGVLPDGELYYSTIFNESKPDRKLILVSFHRSALVDIKDQTSLQRSEPYDYTTGLKTLVIDPDQKFRNEAAFGASPSFVLLDMPNTVNKSQFSTIRQAVAIGGKILPIGLIDAPK